MILWFTAIAACGVGGIARHPQILAALSPSHALGFLVGHFPTAFFALAAVVLAITGAEALYADLGHFGRAPITRAWLVLVFPACILSYLGQGALVLNDPASAISSPFFPLVPGWGRLPMVLLATAATVIASQAVISGSFSVAYQAVQLGYLPRLGIRHTSAQTEAGSRDGRPGGPPRMRRVITAWEAITVAAVASNTIGSRPQSGTRRKNGLLIAPWGSFTPVRPDPDS